MKIRNIIIIAFIACVFACTPILLSFSEIRNGSWLMVKMRDGESLYTRIVYPTNYQAGESRAVILIRTPYNIQDDIYTSIANGLRNAYDSIIVLQDIRGMHGSRDAGGFEVFFSDADDGTDTVNWILQQPWCNGSIATHGASADAANQMTYHAAGAGVKAAFIHAGPSEIYDHWLLPGGCLRKNFIEVWLPREGYSRYADVLAHAAKDPSYWANVSLSTLNRFENVSTRAVHFGGWYDCFQQGTIDSFMYYNYNATEHAKGHQFLVMGPWYHGGNLHTGANYSSVDQGHGLAGTMMKRVFDEALRGIPFDWDSIPHVYYVVMGDPDSTDPKVNQWRSARRWPVLGVKVEPWYFHPGGTLAGTVPATSTNVSYLFDPSDPVHNGGGTTFPPQSPIEPTPILTGAVDNAPIEANRTDVIAFTSSVLASPVEITGRIKATLRVASNCTDTDFTVKLLDVYPDGRRVIVADGILKARYRNGFATPDVEFLVPGVACDIEVDLWSMAYRFVAGHRISVSVSSSNFPKFAVNDNTGGPVTQFLGNSYNIANNTLVVGNTLGVSCIWLPRTE